MKYRGELSARAEVIACSSDVVTLRRLPSSGCSSCSTASSVGCHGATGRFKGRSEVSFSVNYSAVNYEVQVGQQAELFADRRSILTSMARLYGCPLIGLLAGGVLGQILELGEFLMTLAILSGGVSGFSLTRFFASTAPAIEILFSHQIPHAPAASTASSSRQKQV